MSVGGWKDVFAEHNYKGSSPRTVNFTLLSPNWLLPDTSQLYTPLSFRVTLENLRLLPYIVTRLEYGAVEELKHYITDLKAFRETIPPTKAAWSSELVL